MAPILYTLLGILLAVSAAEIAGRFQIGFLSAQRPADYAGTGPVFDVRDSFSLARSLCEGVIYGPTGPRLASRFRRRYGRQVGGNKGTLPRFFPL